MRSSLITTVAVAAALCWYSSSAIAEDTATVPSGTAFSLLLHQKSEGTVIPFTASPPISAGEGYATISYSIGTAAQRANLTKWIEYLAQSLPTTIGNSDGTYIVTLRVKASGFGTQGNDIDISIPIIAIQWTTKNSFLFFPQTVNDVRNTQWTGTIVNQALIGAVTNVQYSVEIAFHKDRSLDFSFLQQASGASQTASLMSLLPMSAASSVLVSSITKLISSIYNNSTSHDVINSDQIDVTKDSTTTANIPIQATNGTFNLPVNLHVQTQMSRVVPGGLVNGKFDKTKVSQTLFGDVQVITGKVVPLSELLATASDDKSKKTRSFLEAIQKNGSYTNNDVDAQCANLVSALDTYVSKANSRALFFSFLEWYSGHIDRNKCLGSGTLKAELDDLGLTFP